jgi:hypothetical protein
MAIKAKSQKHTKLHLLYKGLFDDVVTVDITAYTLSIDIPRIRSRKKGMTYMGMVVRLENATRPAIV